MFESFKKWFNSLGNVASEFNHPDDEAIHVALASLLYHIISADNLASDKEKHKFFAILHDEFELTQQQVSSLYTFVKTLNTDLRRDLDTVNHYLRENPHVRMTFMSKLNQLIAVDGVKNSELEVFYDAMKVIFPEIAEKKQF
jgi:uncharacterized tellurite resistance protein B-like protein